MDASKKQREPVAFKSLAELKRFSGIQFDPALVDILLSLIEDGTIDVTSLYEKSREGR